MEYEMTQEKVKNASRVICEHLNRKGIMKELKRDYLENMQAEYEEEREDYRNFKDWLDYNGDDYINFAFGAYMERLIPLVTDVSEEELSALTSEEKAELLRPFIEYFITKSKIEVRRWFFEKSRNNDKKMIRLSDKDN